MPELPKVSIVTPSYNQGQFLEETILSVLTQDYPNIEYIIIDGGSTDNSVEVIKKYEKDISYWVSEKDKGQSDAINKGFQRATGDIVAWLNSDDLYFKDAVSSAVAQFQAFPDLTLVYGHCVYIDENSQFLHYFNQIEDFSLKRLCNYSDFIMQPTTFFSMKKLKSVGFLDINLHFGMDWDLWCRLAKKYGNFYFASKPIAANREYGATKTNTGGVERIRELHQMLKRHRTSFWPHATIGYSAAEVQAKASSRVGLKRFFLKNLGRVLNCLSPQSVFYNRLTAKKKKIYGFSAENRLPSDEYIFYWPLVRTGKNKLTLKWEFVSRDCPLKQISLKFAGYNQTLSVTGNEIEYALPKAFFEQEKISLNVQFFDEKGKKKAVRFSKIDIS